MRKRMRKGKYRFKYFKIGRAIRLVTNIKNITDIGNAQHGSYLSKGHYGRCQKRRLWKKKY